jgi:hypothetical protein
MKKEALLRKPLVVLLSVLGLLLFAAAAIPVCAQELFNYLLDDSPTPGVPGPPVLLLFLRPRSSFRSRQGVAIAPNGRNGSYKKRIASR